MPIDTPARTGPAALDPGAPDGLVQDVLAEAHALTILVTAAGLPLPAAAIANQAGPGHSADGILAALARLAAQGAVEPAGGPLEDPPLWQLTMPPQS